jgi:hypothetical protein
LFHFRLKNTKLLILYCNSGESKKEKPFSDENNFPYKLLKNKSLSHFWKLFFHDKDIIRWSVFESKINNHLSFGKDKEVSENLLPVSPFGYGLKDSELFKIFYFKNKLFMNNIKNSLDLFNTGMISITTIALKTNYLREDLDLKYVLFYLSSELIKNNLPTYIHSNTYNTMETKLIESYHILISGDIPSDNEGDDSSQMLISGEKLFTPYEFANDEIIGSKSLQDQVTAMLTSREAPTGSYTGSNEFMVNSVIGE